MKILTRYLAFAAIAVILGSCSFAIGSLNHKKSRVVMSAIWHGRTTSATRTVRSAVAARTLSPYVAKSRVLPVRPASAVVRTSRSIAPVRSRDISASTDVDFITYKIVNLAPSSGESAIEDFLDPNYPYIDIFLTPGQNYRITVDVTLLAGSPAATAGAAVGLGSSYGDSADIVVPADGSDVWVDLFVHPVGGIVIKNQLTLGGSTVAWVNPVTGAQPTQSVLPTLTTDPHDKFFYTSDLRLYYFNFKNPATSGSVYEWTNIGSTLSTTTAAFDGTQVSPTFQIYAVCADPVYAGWFYVVGNDTLSGLWGVYWVNYDPPNGVTPAVWMFRNDITADIDYLGSTVSVTGVAADPYGFAYVTFYNTDLAGVSAPASGMIEFDTYYGGSFIFLLTDTTAGWTSANSIFTDVMYWGSNVYVLASPNTTAGTVGNNTGTADVFIFDIYGNQLSTNPSAVHVSYSTAPTLSGSSLTLPNKFAGMIQNGTLFVGQTDFVTGGPDLLSGVALDLSSVRSVP